MALSPNMMLLDPNAQGNQNQNLDFAQLGSLFNAITDEITGGVSGLNQGLLLNQVATMQQGLTNLAANGTFTDGATVTHLQNMADQMSYLTAGIQQYGQGTINGDGFNISNGNFDPKFLNDVVRDVQDIAQADPNLAGMVAANHGFQQTSNLLTPPVPYNDNAAQDAFMVGFVNQSNSLAGRAMAVANGGTDPNLVTDLQNFQTANFAFAAGQDGLWQARFNNEIANNSPSSTAINELIKGLDPNHLNPTLINGAAAVLTQNAADVSGNNQFMGIDIGTGQPVPAPLTPPAADSTHNGGLFFNDAATKLVGGVYSGNQASIVSDLHNAATGVQTDITAQHLTGQSLLDAQIVTHLLGLEAGQVAGLAVSPNPISVTNSAIGFEQAAILGIVNHDPTLAGLANGGFTPNPPTNFLSQNDQGQIAALQNGQGQNMNGQGQNNNDQGLPMQASPTAQAVTDAAHSMTMPAMSVMDLSHMWHHA
jgi:hypothetical protein